MRFRVASAFAPLPLLFCLTALAPRAFAAAPPEAAVDATTLTDMETRAAAAEPRERCYLYTELLHSWTELAGRAMVAGDDSAAQAAMQHADADAEHLKIAISRDSKKLKNAEQLMEHSVHRLSDMLHAATMDQQGAMQAVLKHVTSVHDDLLAAVFAH